ncbi:MAG: phosphoglycerate kinase [Pseudonocardiales bacterium]|nr:phosphoglycerate kinase [Pseudonocardiales bacterium]
MRTLDDLFGTGVAGRQVLVRADLNVPIEDGAIGDDGRIRASLPSLNRLRAHGARLLVAAHLGRPDGRDPAMSLAPVAQRLGELLGTEVPISDAPPGGDGEVAMLENIRFDPRETSKDDAERDALASELAALVGPDGAFVSDGFGVVHRKQASVYDIAHKLPAYAGDLIVKEIKVLRKLADPVVLEPPYTVLLGGSKVSDKMGVIEALLPKVDALLVGGGMCFTFIAALGFEVGDSLLEPDYIEACERFMETDKVLFPTDVVIAKDVSPDAETQIVAVESIPDGYKGLDIGPETISGFAEVLEFSRTVFWNGPMGVFELPPFAAGTEAVAQAVAKVGISVVGGGDSAAAIRQLGLDESAYTHISTGGGASLEYLEGKELPGLAVLEDE